MMNCVAPSSKHFDQRLHRDFWFDFKGFSWLIDFKLGFKMPTNFASLKLFNQENQTKFYDLRDLLKYGISWMLWPIASYLTAKWPFRVAVP